MIGPSGNSEFCFPETLNVPRGEALLSAMFEFQTNTTGN